MTDILVRWLNDELKVSTLVDQTTFAREFASGYLIGEVLNKYQLQDDFDQFSQNKSADSKLNNFTRIEPILHLLEIPFDTNVARDVMTEKHGVATRLLYQLYIALNKKKKSNLTGVAMETMRPAAPAKLNAVESGIYKELLKHATPRQTDLNLEALVARFHENRIEMEKTAFEERFKEQERIRESHQTQRQALIDRSRLMREKQSELVAKIQAATVNIPKPPPEKTAKAIQMRREIRRKKMAEETINAISQFESKMKMMLPPSKQDDDMEGIDLNYILTRDEEKHLIDAVELIKPTSNDDYIGKIRKRLQEDASARAEREKRRRKVLVDQMKAHDAQEEAHREEMLVNRLMRQSQQERRIAVQLLQARHEKEVIRNNRIHREKQYEERRLKDFEDALNREAEMARLAKEEYKEQTIRDQELHNKIAAERAENKYRKHFESCNEVVNLIVDFTCKVAEYRELTDRLVPDKLMREWKALFTAGKPLYEQAGPVESTEPTPGQILEEERQQLLDEGDFTEYKNMIGEWQPSEESEISGPPRDNPIVGHIIQRLFDMVHPPSPPPPPPEFPPFPIRACVLGKVFSGKSSAVQKLAEEHRLQILCTDDLVNDAVEAYKNGEVTTVTSQDTDLEKEMSTTSLTDAAPGIEINIREPTGEGSLTAETVAEPPSEQTIEEKQEKTEEPVEGETTEPKLEEGATDLSAREPSKPPSPVKRSSTRKSKEKEKQPPKPVPTAKAKLGAKAVKYLKKGAPVDDQVIVDIIVEAVRRIPEGTGWILDGFPTTYNQAKVLEKALTGFAVAGQDKDKQKGKMRKSNLVPDPRPPPPPAEPSSGIDVVILFDTQDEVCLKRAAGRARAVQQDEKYHQEFNPPPEGSATGIGKQEQVVPVEDPAYDQEQIQHRITSFLDNWTKLEKWYSKFGTLQKVDAGQEKRTVYLEVEKILEDTLNRLQGKDQEPTSSALEVTEPVPEKKEEPPAPPPEPPKEEPPPVESSRPTSRKGSGKKPGSRTSSRSKSPKDKKSDKSASPKRGSGKSAGSKKGSGESTPKSPKRGKGSGKKGKTPEPEPEPEPEVPQGPPPPQPGSEEWEFIDEAVEEELAKILAEHWAAVEKTYVSNSKHVFRSVREERENIYRYFFQIRKDFLSYLRRPDNKQAFITRWQQEYNEVADDVRDDEETKAEIHQRVNDLRECLWNICDERKLQAETELENIKTDGWLEDRLGVLSNFYITLMQGEVDRYQDTVRLLKDYYRGMEGQIPDELNKNYARIPLIELPVDRPDSPEKAGSEAVPTPPPQEETTGSAKSERPRSKSPRSRSKSPKSPKERSKSRTPSGKKRDKSKEKKPADTSTDQTQVEDGTKKRIPLVPRRPVSPDPDAKGGAAAKDKKDKKKKDDGAPDSPAPPVDLDEKLIFDAFQTGTNALGSMLSHEMAAREAEEEAEKKKEEEKAKEQAAAAAKKPADKGKGGKGKGKSRSPSPKKNKGSDSASQTPPPSEDLTEEEREKKERKDKMRQEYYFAIQEEESAAKTRLEQIKAHSISILQDLKGKGDNAYKDMNDWLGARFLKEMESIDQMSEVMRNAIENKQKLNQELLLQQEDFLINEDLKVLKTPSPPSPPPPEEQPTLEQFTVDQLNSIYKQFASTAPTGVMSSRSFVETFENIVAVAHGMEQLPDVWMNITPGQIQEIANGLSADAEYVDWRRFLLAAAQPLPWPTQTELLETLQKFKDMDQKATGFVTREQYDRMDLWFGGKEASNMEFDRLGYLKGGMFDFFADHSRTPAVLDYVSMLMYFSAASHASEGFLRALSVASNMHMPRLPKPEPRPPSVAESTDIVDDPSPPPPIPDDIPQDAVDALVPMEALYRVFHHGESAAGDSHRFSVSADPEDATSREKLASVYQELGSSENLEPLMYRVLIEHPLIQDIVGSCQTFKSLDLKSILNNPNPDMDMHSTKTLE